MKDQLAAAPRGQEFREEVLRVTQIVINCMPGDHRPAPISHCVDGASKDWRNRCGDHNVRAGDAGRQRTG
jgi:hypothetical protein